MDDITSRYRMGRPPRYDIAVDDFRKNANERVRVTLHEFNGMDLVNVRVWLDATGGHDVSKMVPTPKGITLNVSLLPRLHEALGLAVAVALKSGLLGPSGAAAGTVLTGQEQAAAATETGGS